MQRNMLKNDEKLDKRIRPNKAMKGLKKKTLWYNRTSNLSVKGKQPKDKLQKHLNEVKNRNKFWKIFKKKQILQD